MNKSISYVGPNWDVAYSSDYLLGVMNLIRLVFIQMNELTSLNIYDQIDAYMQTSDIRKKMDVGNWSALMKGWKQVYNSVNFENCKNDNEKLDDAMLHWMADIYTYWQWRYNISSKEISRRCDALLLSKLYYPLHEASVQCACEKLQSRFFENPDS